MFLLPSMRALYKNLKTESFNLLKFAYQRLAFSIIIELKTCRFNRLT